jgi:hypothetical protein
VNRNIHLLPKIRPILTQAESFKALCSELETLRLRRLEADQLRQTLAEIDADLNESEREWEAKAASLFGLPADLEELDGLAPDQKDTG